MNRMTRRILDLAEQHKASLLLLVVIAGLGMLSGTPPHTPAEAKAAIHRVYSLEAQPLVCAPERHPPSR